MGAIPTNPQGVLSDFNATGMVQSTLTEIYQGILPVNDPKKLKIKMNKTYYVKGISIPMATLDAAPKLEYRTVRRDINLRHSWKPNRKYHMVSAQRGSIGTLKPDDYNFTAPSTGAFWTPTIDAMPPYGQWLEEKYDYFKNESKGEHKNSVDLNLRGAGGAGIFLVIRANRISYGRRLPGR